MHIGYEELFKATLSMFAIDEKSGSVVSASHIQAIFNEVLKADELCYKDFMNRPSVYDEEGVKEL